MNETEVHQVKRDSELNSFFSFMSGCLGCTGAYLSRDGFNWMAGLCFLLSVGAIIFTVLVSSREPEEVKE